MFIVESLNRFEKVKKVWNLLVWCLFIFIFIWGLIFFFFIFGFFESDFIFDFILFDWFWFFKFWGGIWDLGDEDFDFWDGVRNVFGVYFL